MTTAVATIVSVSLIIFLSPFISRFIHFPIIAIEIILGSIFANLGYIHQSEIFIIVAELGFFYLMFLAGLEVDFKQLLYIDKNTLNKGIIYITLPYIISSIFVFYFNLSKIYIVTMPLISLGMIASLKKEYGKTNWIELAITIGLLGEIISILVLTLVSGIIEFGFSIEFYKNIFLLIVVFFLLVLTYKLFYNFLWWYPETKEYLMPKFDNFEQDIRVSMAIFFIMIALMLYLHLEIAFGAFIAGTFIATFFTHNKELPKKLEYFGFGWLVPIFFISIGANFDINSLLLEGLILTAIIISISMFLVKLISSLVFYKNLKKDIVLFAISHSMPLTLLIAVVTLAYNNSSIDKFHYLAFILASILEVLFGMIAIKLLKRR